MKSDLVVRGLSSNVYSNVLICYAATTTSLSLSRSSFECRLLLINNSALLGDLRNFENPNWHGGMAVVAAAFLCCSV